jgi:NADH:ubiquinone oxidoreductase subunit D
MSTQRADAYHYCLDECSTDTSALQIRCSTLTVLTRSVLTEYARVENHLLNVACHAGDVKCLVSLLAVVRTIIYRASRVHTSLLSIHNGP